MSFLRGPPPLRGINLISSNNKNKKKFLINTLSSHFHTFQRNIYQPQRSLNHQNINHKFYNKTSISKWNTIYNNASRHFSKKGETPEQAQARRDARHEFQRDAKKWRDEGASNEIAVLPKSDVELVEKMKESLPWWDKYRPTRLFMRPLRLGEDLPMLIDKNDPNVKPVVLLPRANHDWMKFWGAPEIVIIPRKQVFTIYFWYFFVAAVIATLMGIPPALDLLKDAEKKHKVLQEEVKKEDQHFLYLANQMTYEELEEALDPLPLRPGTEYNPIIEEEVKRISRRVQYPG